MRSRRRNRGFVLVAILASMAAVLTIVGLAIDTGHLQMVKVRMQTAADAAAIGAVQDGKAGGPAGPVASGRANASANGFTHGLDTVAVAVNSPPATGYFTGDSTAVEVTIRKTVATFFMALAGFPRMGVSARAVARRAPGQNCVFALDSAAPGAISASGGAIVQVNCGVMVNSSDNTALTVSGGARINAARVSIVGNYSASGGGAVSPAPAIHVLAEPDPLAHVPPPSAGACTRTGYSVTSGQIVTISEGVYCGGISVSGGARLFLNPGTYVLQGGGLTVSGMSTLTGAGVTFYNTSGAGYPYAPVALAGGATIQLSAPTSGPLAGMLFFQDRSVVGGAASTLSGNASSYCNGALYFPTTALTYSGGTDSQYTIIVAKTIGFSGGAILKSDYTPLPDGPPMKAVAALGE